MVPSAAETIFELVMILLRPRISALSREDISSDVGNDPQTARYTAGARGLGGS